MVIFYHFDDQNETFLSYTSEWKDGISISRCNDDENLKKEPD